MLTLYYSPGACSLAPHIALEEAGARYDAKAISLKKGQHKKPDYLAINPRGQVPTLVVDGKPLTQNMAILSYIAQSFPDAHLIPTEPFANATALSWLAFLSSTVHPSFGPLFGPQTYVADPAAREAYVAKLHEILAQRLADIDRSLPRDGYALGAFSVVDAFLVPFYRWAKLHFGYDMSAYPAYTAHHERMLARPAVQRVLAREEAAQTELEAAA